MLKYMLEKQLCNEIKRKCFSQPARCKGRTKKLRKLQKPANSEKALNYLDTFCGPSVGNHLWHSVRLALLSDRQYCAVVNNSLTNSDEIQYRLLEDGATDIRHYVTNDSQITQPVRTSSIIEVERAREQATEAVLRSGTYSDEVLQRSGSEPVSESDMWHSADDPDHGRDLDSFVPATRVYSEQEQLQLQEVSEAFYNEQYTPQVVPGDTPAIPRHLCVHVKSRGDLTGFRSPRCQYGSHGLFDYYLMDAASILPVVALRLEPGDRVLDMCAAPGGKSLCILQTALPELLVCNDITQSRTKRVRDVLHSFVPLSEHENVDFLTSDGTKTELFTSYGAFNKVLVDAPCLTDRHVISYENNDNNIFTGSRTKERLALPDLQRDLICSGLELLKPGGTLVYSTCTLSSAQNDGAVAAALDFVWRNSNMDVVVEDTTSVANYFSNIFRFCSRQRFGQLVLPELPANYGPMYFSKLVRRK